MPSKNAIAEKEAEQGGAVNRMGRHLGCLVASLPAPEPPPHPITDLGR